VLFSPRQQRASRLRIPRRLLAAVVMALYVLAGALHGLSDLDVTHASATATIGSIDNDFDQSDKGVAAEHHCHGCFPVSLPVPIAAAVAIEPTPKAIVPTDELRPGLPPGIDPPPPKFLT
jgi:hypothetical protein